MISTFSCQLMIIELDPLRSVSFLFPLPRILHLEHKADRREKPQVQVHEKSWLKGRLDSISFGMDIK